MIIDLQGTIITTTMMTMTTIKMMIVFFFHIFIREIKKKICFCKTKEVNQTSIIIAGGDGGNDRGLTKYRVVYFMSPLILINIWFSFNEVFVIQTCGLNICIEGLHFISYLIQLLDCGRIGASP